MNIEQLGNVTGEEEPNIETVENALESVAAEETNENVESAAERKERIIAEAQALAWRSCLILANQVTFHLCHMEGDTFRDIQEERLALEEELFQRFHQPKSALYDKEKIAEYDEQQTLEAVQDFYERVVELLHKADGLDDGIILRKVNIPQDENPEEGISESEAPELVPEEMQIEIPEVGISIRENTEPQQEGEESQPLMIEGLQSVGARRGFFESVRHRVDLWKEKVRHTFEGDEFEDAATVQQTMQETYTANKRQQDKLLGVLDNIADETRSRELWNAREVHVDPRRRKQIEGRIASGILNEYHMSEELNHIMLPISKEEDEKGDPLELLHEIQKYPLYADLISHMINEEKMGFIAIADLKEFYQDHPNPRSIEYRAAELLKLIRDRYPDADHYGLLREFTHLVYGKRAEYHEQFRLMQDDIRNRPRGGEDVSDAPSEQLSAEVVNTPPQESEVPHNEVSEGREITAEHFSEASIHHPERNEDSVLEMHEVGAFGVFDGVGGADAGDKASRIVRDHMEREIQNIPSDLSLPEAEEYIKVALFGANEAVLEQAEFDRTNMASTAVVSYIWKGENNERKMILAHVGDSRAYRMRNEALEQLTVDHSMVNQVLPNLADQKVLQGITANTEEPEEIISELKKKIELSKEQEDGLRLIYTSENPDISPQVITRALGRRGVEPTIETFDIQDGDSVYLFSDGITDNIRDKELQDLLLNDATLGSLVKTAVDADRKPDDMSLQKILM